MKGILFNVVEDVVTEALSADAWDDVVAAAGVAGSYTSLGTYPDEELVAIVGAAADAAGLTVDDTLRLAGRLGFKYLAERAPHLLEGIDDWQSLIGNLDDIIHPEVRKIYPDAEVPGFASEAIDGGLRVTYSSRRGMSALAEGLMHGCAEWYGAEIVITYVDASHPGGSLCVMTAVERPRDAGGTAT